MNILITGGAGYIGSHTVLELLTTGHHVTIVDNLSNSSRESISRVEKITSKKVDFHEFDLRNDSKLRELFQSNQFDAVIHFAGLKSVGESISHALHYYDNNLQSTISLLKAMQTYDVKNLVFSSSATVYGDPSSLPIKETAQKSATNPYGQTKLMIEQMLEDISNTKNGWCITSLRYFNPIGAHSSGLIGEDPSGIPNNILPYIAQVAIGKLNKVKVFGSDYDTPDGTGLRDYIHVTDLAHAHIAALDNINHPNEYKAYNIGTGIAVSVLDLVNAFSIASGQKVAFEYSDRRPGDIASCYADPTLASIELGWKAQLSLQDACNSSWNWQSKNPNGYLA